LIVYFRAIEGKGYALLTVRQSIEKGSSINYLPYVRIPPPLIAERRWMVHTIKSVVGPRIRNKVQRRYALGVVTRKHL
jgi:hypothetical protein